MGSPLKYAIEHEAWNVYQIEDGTVLRMRVILSRIARNGSDKDGKPIYTFDHSLITQVEPNAADHRIEED
jgi:hypothetical protein